MAHLETLIGNTPMADLRSLGAPFKNVRILAKLEGNNPGGSVKDRTALGMFMGAEAAGTIQPGDRIIEPTSGNTGIALAMLAAKRGYRLTLVMPESMTVERRAVMAAYGADFVLTPAAQGMEGTIDQARAMVADGEGVMFDQFANPQNWRIHYRTTGPEIWNDTGGRVTHFVSAMGTTGTIMGVSRLLKENNPNVEIIGVHPAPGSAIPGIRRWPEEYLPKIFEPKRVDRVLEVTAEEAKVMARRMAREEGIFCGPSSGGAVAAALEVAAECKGADTACIVVILPDRGDRYLSAGIF